MAHFQTHLSPACSPSSSWRRGRSSTVLAILPSRWILVYQMVLRLALQCRAVHPQSAAPPEPRITNPRMDLTSSESNFLSASASMQSQLQLLLAKSEDTEPLTRWRVRSSWWLCRWERRRRNNSLSSSQPSGQKNQSFMEMIQSASAKGTQEEEKIISTSCIKSKPCTPLISLNSFQRSKQTKLLGTSGTYSKRLILEPGSLMDQFASSMVKRCGQILALSWADFDVQVAAVIVSLSGRRRYMTRNLVAWNRTRHLYF